MANNYFNVEMLYNILFKEIYGRNIMGKAIAINTMLVRSVGTHSRNLLCNARNPEFPIEFENMPLLPPAMKDPGNPDKYWMIHEEWKSPPINGHQVCVRAPVELIDGRTFGFFTDGIFSASTRLDVGSYAPV